MVCYGYRYGEVILPKINPIKRGTSISDSLAVDLTKRPPVLVSMGCHVEGVARPHADPEDPETTKAGVRMRAARAPPVPNRKLLRRLRRFVRKWIRKNFVPLEADIDLSVQAWLESTSYSRARKDELLKKWEEFTHIDDPVKRYKMCKSFMKDECYDDLKHARGINSRSDEFKCLVGPIFKKIEEKVFKHKSFIKHVPVADRPKYIMDLLYTNGSQYGATDFTAFESLFTAEIMESVEFELYDYLTMNMIDNNWFMKVCKDVLAGTNVCRFRSFVVKMLATRMSGEMCTSLGNGFSNLMFMLFLCKEIGSKHTVGVVEGDDGLFRTTGRFPTTEEFAELGLNIKIEIKNSISEASFCGILFDPEDLVNVCDVNKMMASFGWTTRQYGHAGSKTMKKLLRAKALSFAYQYPGCPIVTALSQYGLRVTRGTRLGSLLDRMKNSSYYHLEILRTAIKDEKNIRVVQPPMNTRLLVEKLYGISVEQQVNIEAYLDSLNDIRPLRLDTVVWNPKWEQYFEKYSGYTLSSLERDPGDLWCTMAGHVKEW